MWSPKFTQLIIDSTTGKGHRDPHWMPHLWPPLGSCREKAWVPLLIHCKASNPIARPLAPRKLLLTWPLNKPREPPAAGRTELRTASPSPWRSTELSVGFKRYLKRLQIIPVIYLLGSIYWPGRRGCLGHFSKLEIVNVLEDSYILCTDLLHKRMRTHTLFHQTHI